MTFVVNETAKNKYRRLRPYPEHPDTVRSLLTVGVFSYPSGHSMGAFTLAVVLGAIFPDKQQAFLDRMIDGWQHQEDIEAIAFRFFGSSFRCPAFRQMPGQHCGGVDLLLDGRQPLARTELYGPSAMIIHHK